MTEEERRELAYLAAQVEATRRAAAAAIDARDAYMRQLDREGRHNKDIAAAVGLSEPQTLRIVSREVPSGTRD